MQVVATAVLMLDCHDCNLFVGLQMAIQLGQAGVDINTVLGQQRQQQQQQHPAAAQQPQMQAAHQPQPQQQQLGRGMGPAQQRGPTPTQQQGWPGASHAAAASLNPGSREFRPGQQHPGARGMVRHLAAAWLLLSVASWEPSSVGRQGPDACVPQHASSPNSFC